MTTLPPPPWMCWPGQCLHLLPPPSPAPPSFSPNIISKPPSHSTSSPSITAPPPHPQPKHPSNQLHYSHPCAGAGGPGYLKRRSCWSKGSTKHIAVYFVQGTAQTFPFPNKIALKLFFQTQWHPESAPRLIESISCDVLLWHNVVASVNIYFECLITSS